MVNTAVEKMVSPSVQKHIKLGHCNQLDRGKGKQVIHNLGIIQFEKYAIFLTTMLLLMDSDVLSHSILETGSLLLYPGFPILTQKNTKGCPELTHLTDS